MSLVKAAILSRSGQLKVLKVYTLLVYATITYGVSYMCNYSFLFVLFFSTLEFLYSQIVF